MEQRGRNQQEERKQGLHMYMTFLGMEYGMEWNGIWDGIEYGMEYIARDKGENSLLTLTKISVPYHFCVLNPFGTGFTFYILNSI